MTVRVWTHDETTRARWRYDAGPWDDEPDKAQWIDADTGLDCLILRNPLGGLCGYVGVPNTHPLYEVHYEDAPEHVHNAAHGGLTYSDTCNEDADEGHGICHVPEPGRPDDVWWLGFDCVHAGDLAPSTLGRGVRFPDDVYRDFEYVQRKCASLAAELAKAGVAA